MVETAGEAIAETIDGAISSAEARADAAEAVIETLTDAAIRDKLSARIGDCEEGISTCQDDLEEAENEIQALQIVSNQQSQEIARLSGQVSQIQQQLTEIHTLVSSRLTLPNSQEDQQNQSEAPISPEPRNNPPDADGDDHREAEQEHEKTRRGRLI